MTSLQILYVSSEITGFAKTGGLADVAAALPRALAQRGHRVTVFMPLYACVRHGTQPFEPTPHVVRVALGKRLAEGRIWKSKLPDSDVPLYLIEHAGYFERDDTKLGTGLYQLTNPTGQKVDYPDNSERFTFFQRAVLEALPLLDLWPDIVHANDWQTGLMPAFLKENYGKFTRPQWRSRYAAIRSMFTIHNLAYQGVFWYFDWPMLNLPTRLFNSDQVEFFGSISFLKAGLVFADRLTAVSPTYAREIQTPYFGCGLQGVILRRTARLTGIVNGIDVEAWNPATDPFLDDHYSIEAMAGKARCKRALQMQLGLDVDPAMPLLGMVSRLASQKGLDLLEKIAPFLLEQKVQLVVLGTGDPLYHEFLTKLAQAFPTQVGIRLALDEALAHKIEAGSDMFLMPSQYEPCGLNQLYSLRYGTVPIVRATGGLADTVVDATPEALENGTASGFHFVSYTPEAFLAAVQRALDLYRHDRPAWAALQRTGMTQDWSWNHAAAEYESLYRRLMDEE